jgi:hypothetical protein
MEFFKNMTPANGKSLLYSKEVVHMMKEIVPQRVQSYPYNSGTHMFIAKDISHVNSNVSYGLLGYDAMFIGNLLATYQRNFLPP